MFMTRLATYTSRVLAPESGAFLIPVGQIPVKPSLMTTYLRPLIMLVHFITCLVLQALPLATSRCYHGVCDVSASGVE